MWPPKLGVGAGRLGSAFPDLPWEQMSRMSKVQNIGSRRTEEWQVEQQEEMLAAGATVGALIESSGNSMHRRFNVQYDTSQRHQTLRCHAHEDRKHNERNLLRLNT